MVELERLKSFALLVVVVDDDMFANLRYFALVVCAEAVHVGLVVVVDTA